jgi:hypothetical protein
MAMRWLYEETMNQEKKQFKIAIPSEMKRWLAVEAAKNMRSQSAEILLAVREKMDRQENEKAREPLTA